MNRSSQSRLAWSSARLRVASGLALVAALILTRAQGEPLEHGDVLPLWTEGVPGLRDLEEAETLVDGRYRSVSEPTMTYFAPREAVASATAVIIFPGGGYNHVSFSREGEAYAEWLSERGVSSFVVKYRLKQYGHPAPLQDALRAIRLVRSRADELAVAPDRIGVMGSSAGGHLAATASTLYGHVEGLTGAALDAVSARPDFTILLYPVIALEGPAAHVGSRLNLLGSEPSASELQLLSPHKQVHAEVPPTLLIHTQEDQAVVAENSWLYFQALTKAGVPAELHLFERGGHGVGMRSGLGTTSQWPERLEDWLRQRGYLVP